MKIPVLFRNHFQLGYVVRNLGAAIARMRESFGVSKWEVRHLPRSAPSRALAFAYVERTMIELIDVWPEQETIFQAWRPAVDCAIRLHHLGYMLETEQEWRDVIAQFDAAGIRTAFAGSAGKILDYRYFDTVESLGHYCEFVRLKPAGKDFWANVPQN